MFDTVLRLATVSSGVSSEQSAEPEGGPGAFMRALNVPRNARLGFAFGLVFTVAVYVFFVVIPGAIRSPLWYLALAFVLFVGVGGLATTVLTLMSAYRLSRRL
jgi:hypothetical protein